jgi:DNA polymerase III subunit delta'
VSFETVTGQDRAVEDLTRAMASGRVPHAFLFTGPSGVGKATVAGLFAKSLLCPKAKPLACGKCPSCHRVDALTHADLSILSVPEDKSEIPAAAVRELCARLAESPMEGKRKVAIVDPADRMNQEGQNVFLKTLEEPPLDTVILLVAENVDVILPTVRSRCRRVTFAPIAQDAVDAFLKARGASADTARTLARLAQGSFGEAARLMDGTFAEDRAAIIQAILAAAPGAEEKLTEIIASGGAAKGKKAAKERREDVVMLLAALHSVLVDAIRFKAGAPIRVNADLAHAIRAFAGEVDLDAITALEKEVSDAIIVVAGYVDVRLVALRLASAFARRPSPAQSGRG